MLLSGELRVSIMLAESLCRDHTNSARTLICIPIGGEMLEKVGSRIVVIWLGCVLLFSMFLFMTHDGPVLTTSGIGGFAFSSWVNMDRG